MIWYVVVVMVENLIKILTPHELFNHYFTYKLVFWLYFILYKYSFCYMFFFYSLINLVFVETYNLYADTVTFYSFSLSSSSNCPLLDIGLTLKGSLDLLYHPMQTDLYRVSLKFSLLFSLYSFLPRSPTCYEEGWWRSLFLIRHHMFGFYVSIVL